MPSTTALRNLIIDHLLGKAAWSLPSDCYVCLFTGEPSESTPFAREVSGGSYARAAIKAHMPIATGGFSTNTAEITFPTATASWGTVTHMGIASASTGGTLYFYKAVDGGPKAVNTGMRPRYAPGTFSTSGAL